MLASVLILTEAGKTIGLGHYTRCLALYDTIKVNGNEVNMMVYLNQFEINNTSLIKKNWLENLSEVLPYKNSDIVVIDSYLASASVYSYLSTIFKKVVAIDDYNRISYPANLLINPNVFFSNMNYTNQVAKCLGGKEFVILRSEFRDNNQLPIINNTIEEVLVTIGGSDFRNILPTILNICLKMSFKKVTVIAPETIKFSQKSEKLSILPLQNAANMSKLMQQADIVIAACGQTLHELASLGKPTVGICLDIDQIPNQKYYLKENFLATPISWNDTDFVEKIQNAIELLSPFERRQKIAINAPLLININGVNNIITAINKSDA